MHCAKFEHWHFLESHEMIESGRSNAFVTPHYPEDFGPFPPFFGYDMRKFA